MSFLQRRRARFLIKRAQGFADEPLVAVANFTWVGNSMAAQPGVRGRGEWAGGLPDWTLIGAGENGFSSSPPIICGPTWAPSLSAAGLRHRCK
jgi:hypothetical protein